MRINRINIIRIIFMVYICAVFTLTFIVRETMILRNPDSRGVILIPFREFDAFLHQPNHRFWFMQIFLNVLMLVPFGFLFPLISERFKSLPLTVFSGFVLSSSIEIMQYITGRGVTEIDDVINNTAGAFVGYLMYALVREYMKKREYV